MDVDPIGERGTSDSPSVKTRATDNQEPVSDFAVILRHLIIPIQNPA